MNVTAASGKRGSKRATDGRGQAGGVINHNNHLARSTSEGPSKQASESAKKAGNTNHDGQPNEASSTVNGETSERSKSGSLQKRSSKKTSAAETPKLRPS